MRENDFPSLADKVRFLKRPESFPEPTTGVEAVETHMSWVFLTDRHAYKLKKPVRFKLLNFSTLEDRRRSCEAEVLWNRRLAPGVYLGVVPLGLDENGRLALERGSPQPERSASEANRGARAVGVGPHGTEGSPVVEWLVKMRRLPAEKMLDRLIAGGKVEAADLRRVADLLSVFYQRAPRVTLTEEGYRLRFVRDVEEIDRELREISPIPEERIAAVSAELLGFTRNRADLLLARARERRIVEAHGDLRPEHVCCLSPPVVIDCLEFAPELRALDPADELSFLTVECELAGGVLNPSAARAERVAEREPWGWGPTAVTEAPLIERILFEAYTARNLDRPEALLVRFYKAFRAFVRAKIAIWHLRDPDVKDASRWVSKADRYVEAAARLVRPSPDSPESFS